LDVALVTPRFDPATVYSSTLGRWMVDLLRGHPRVRLRHFHGLGANAYSVRRYLRAHDPPLVVYLGHGLRDRWVTGLLGWLLGDDLADELDGAIVLTLACKTLDAFACRAIEDGAVAYIGNSRTVWGPASWGGAYPTLFARPWFGELVNLLRGVSVADTVAQARHDWADLAFQLEQGDVQARDHARLALENGTYHGFVGRGAAALPAAVTLDELNPSVLARLAGEGGFP
jgi:hypothetical protein